jgi:hypothetical protein
MKKIFALAMFVLGIAGTLTVSAQSGDKSKRPSPPAEVTATLASGATIRINYSQPSVKGRTIGKDLEPMDGQVWRTGANEATVFETSKDIKINGQKLPAGKYGLFTIAGDKEWILIFNKTWDQWGAYDYKEADDVMRVSVKASKPAAFAEKMTFTIDKSGTIVLNWGDRSISFKAD